MKRSILLLLVLFGACTPSRVRVPIPDTDRPFQTHADVRTWMEYFYLHGEAGRFAEALRFRTDAEDDADYCMDNPARPAFVALYLEEHPEAVEGLVEALRPIFESGERVEETGRRCLMMTLAICRKDACRERLDGLSREYEHLGWVRDAPQILSYLRITQMLDMSEDRGSADLALNRFYLTGDTTPLAEALDEVLAVSDQTDRRAELRLTRTAARHQPIAELLRERRGTLPAGDARIAVIERMLRRRGDVDYLNAARRLEPRWEENALALDLIAGTAVEMRLRLNAPPPGLRLRLVRVNGAGAKAETLEQWANADGRVLGEAALSAPIDGDDILRLRLVPEWRNAVGDWVGFEDSPIGLTEDFPQSWVMVARKEGGAVPLLENHDLLIDLRVLK